MRSFLPADAITESAAGLSWAWIRTEIEAKRRDRLRHHQELRRRGEMRRLEELENRYGECERRLGGHRIMYLTAIDKHAVAALKSGYQSTLLQLIAIRLDRLKYLGRVTASHRYNHVIKDLDEPLKRYRLGSQAIRVVLSERRIPISALGCFAALVVIDAMRVVGGESMPGLDTVFCNQVE
jgi:hypothetical protein